MEGAAEVVEDEGNSGLEGRSIMCASVHLAGRYASLGAANGLAFARTAASMLRQTTARWPQNRALRQAAAEQDGDPPQSFACHWSGRSTIP